MQNNPQAYEPDLAMSYNNLAILYSNTQKYDLAEELHKKAIEIREREVESNPQVYEPDLAISYNNLANIYVLNQRYDIFFEYAKKAFVLAKKYKDSNGRCEDIYNTIKTILEE